MRSFSVPGKRAKKYLERDGKVVSQSYPRVYPFMMDHGLGSEVWDVDGNRYIDFSSGIAVCSTGHCHPKVVEAIKQQVERYLHISSDFYHPIWIEFSEKLASTSPFKESARIFLCNSGSEAVETSIKLARYHSGRQQFIGFFGGLGARGARGARAAVSVGAFALGVFAGLVVAAVLSLLYLMRLMSPERVCETLTGAWEGFFRGMRWAGRRHGGSVAMVLELHALSGDTLMIEVVGVRAVGLVRVEGDRRYLVAGEYPDWEACGEDDDDDDDDDDDGDDADDEGEAGPSRAIFKRSSSSSASGATGCWVTTRKRRGA